MKALVLGANAKSKVFYTKMKGALDDAVQALGFPGCFILRPLSLVRKGSNRFGEKAGIVALKALNAIGLIFLYDVLLYHIILLVLQGNKET